MSRLFDVRPNSSAKSEADRAAILANPGFGTNFTDHMATATWTPEQGWHDREVGPYRPFELDPAAAVLHYAQEIFEGLKAYRHGNDSIWLFRPDKNAERFVRSAGRLALPALPPEEFLSSIETLISTDQAWVPSGGETSLYVRPFMFASETFLGVRPAKHVTYACIASPAGSYFSGGLKPVKIWLTTQYLRAAPRGGMGASKTGGNYAASLVAQQEAAENGCDQVLFLDGAERTYLEELGGMNVFLITSDQELITPELSGAFLEGVVRDSAITLAAERGLTVVERKVAVEELLDGIRSGRITEGFACGTAAVITPIGVIKTADGEFTVGDGAPGPHTEALRSTLLDVQYGRAEDRHGWMRKVC